MDYDKSSLRPTTLYDRVKKLLVSYEWSDCSFLVSEKIFKAHRLILSTSSPVFQAMFYGPLSTNHDITITDIEPEIFQLLLTYIYTDHIEILSVEQAFELLYASRKYMLDNLSDMCITFIRANLCFDNVITILNYLDYMQDPQIKSDAVNYFCEHARYLFREIKDPISHQSMKTILESNNINISEKDLIKHVFEWTRQYCEQNDILVNFENRRNVLLKDNLLKLLRFYTLTMDDLNEISKDKSNLLLPIELENIEDTIKQTQINDQNTNNLTDLKLSPRSSFLLRWFNNICHRRMLRPAPPIIINCNSIVQCRIKGSKSIFINSLTSPTRLAPVFDFQSNVPKTYLEQFVVTVLSETDNCVVNSTDYYSSLVKYDSYIDIELSEPCFIRKDEWYKIIITWPQNRSNLYTYVVGCRDSFVNNQTITLEFEDLTLSAGSVDVIGSFLSGIKFCL